jgi:hypothetical protein
MNYREVRMKLREHDVEPINLWNDYKNVWILEYAELSPSTYTTLIEEFNAGWIHPENEKRVSVTIEI